MPRNIASIHETTNALTPEVVTANSGTSGTTFAAGNDSRITGAAQKSSNLSDLANAGTARTNLGLGDSATKSVGTGAGSVAAGDDPRIVGAAARANAVIARPVTGTPVTVTYDTLPIGMDSQGRLLRCSGTVLQRSADDGATWATIYTLVAGFRMLAIRQMDNGELVASTADDGVTHVRKSRLYVSSGYAAGGAITFTQILEADDYEQGFYLEWGWGGSAGVYAVSAYDTKATNLRSGVQKVYLTTDSFATAPTAILDVGTGSTGNRHVHGAVYDQYRDAVWVTCGDGSSKVIKVSWDARTAGAAATWTDIVTNTQCTAIMVFPQCVAFGSDGLPNAIMRIPNPSVTNLVMKVAYRIDYSSSSTVCAEAPYRLPGNGSVTYLPFSRITTGQGFILASTDGFAWWEAWVDSRSLATPQGPRFAFGPTAGNKLLTWIQDSGLSTVTIDLANPGLTSTAARVAQHADRLIPRRSYARYGSAAGMSVPNVTFTEYVVVPNADTSDAFSGLFTLASDGKGVVVNRECIVDVDLDSGLDQWAGGTGAMVAVMLNGSMVQYSRGKTMHYKGRVVAGTRISCAVYQATGGALTADGSSRCMQIDAWEIL